MQMTTAAEDRGMGKVWVAYDDMNVDKCKIMISNDWVDNTEIQIGNAAVEMTEEFCYLGSKYVTSNSSCDKDNKNRQCQQPSTVHWNITPAGKTTKELDRHHRTRFEKHRHNLGSSTTARCQQRRLASTCGHVSFTRDELR